MKKLILVLILVSGTSGCKEEEIKSIDFYLHNDDERSSVLLKCETMSDFNKNCINASKAQMVVDAETTREFAQDLYGVSD